jgi:FkbH-like protein
LCEAAWQDGVLLLDVARASQRDGINAWFDAGYWLQGKLEIAPQAAPLYGDMVARILAAQRGLSKKCLVLDLDNTLWGGVIGDDGLEGIVLGEGSAVGEAHLALQRYAKQLKERGVILAVCSKNDAGIAETAFRDHPEMLLRRSDIAAFLANWDDKTENLKAIATRLNIGLDSLVFVDDNPVERTRIRQSLPMVAVPELPEDTAQYVRCLADAGYFEAVAFTSEDRHRAQQYAENSERDALLESAQSMDEFLRGLEMSVLFGPFTPLDHPRIVQLINKTNQFNTTTRRYTPEEITYIINNPDVLTLQFRLLDRIGDNGLVSTMILRPTADREKVLEIENWVMSCRVFGRELEFEAMNIAVEVALRRGARALVANYIPTAKNYVTSGLYPGLGFAEHDQLATADGATRWFLKLVDYVARETHIMRVGAAS